MNSKISNKKFDQICRMNEEIFVLNFFIHSINLNEILFKYFKIVNIIPGLKNLNEFISSFVLFQQTQWHTCHFLPHFSGSMHLAILYGIHSDHATYFSAPLMEENTVTTLPMFGDQQQQ